MTIAYDGSEFHGWQRQPRERTVQGHLEQTMSRLFGREIALSGTSRTDAGVHALGQRASFRADIGIPIDRLARVLNNALCGSEPGSFALSPVRILCAEEMPADFHARFDAKGKQYIYRILPGGRIDPFRRNYVYHVAEALDAAAMQEAARYLVGTHDFKSFESAGGNPRQTTVRTIFDVQVTTAQQSAAPGTVGFSPEASGAARVGGTDAAQTTGQLPGGAPFGGAPSGDDASGDAMLPAADDELRIAIRGDGFLYNMVRIITGTLVEVGRGRRAPEDLKRIIEAADRQQAGHTAPPYGLYLARVYYEEAALTGSPESAESPIEASPATPPEALPEASPTESGERG